MNRRQDEVSSSTPNLSSAGIGNSASTSATSNRNYLDIEHAAKHIEDGETKDRDQRTSPPSSIFWKLALLTKVVGVTVALLVVFHAASCGYFFCMNFPGARYFQFTQDFYSNFQDVYALTGGSKFSVLDSSLHNGKSYVMAHDSGDESAPLLIPKIIHQTYMTKDVPQILRYLMQSWTSLNPDWQFRFYDDESCLSFVKREFPEYLEAYLALPKNVERSDFFRYMVVLRLGGVYADIDTECKVPLSDLLEPYDTLVVGWENEFSSAEEARSRKYVRKRQILQWVFAASPGHPVLRETCERIAKNVYESYNDDKNLDTLERTGPGLWTDIVMEHAVAHTAAMTNDPWKVRVMPKVAFGAHPLGLDGLSGDFPGVAVLHHFLGSWKRSFVWSRQKDKLLNSLSNMLKTKEPTRVRSPPAVGMESSLPRDLAEKRLYPVSISALRKSFTMWVDLVGHGDMQSGSDVAASLTAFGTWQPTSNPSKSPTYLDVLMDALLGDEHSKNVFVDVGAGLGFFSMAAASAGHPVIAFEVSENNIRSFNYSLQYNGFSNLVRLQTVPLGSAEETICLDSNYPAGKGGADAVATRRGYGSVISHTAVFQDIVDAYSPVLIIEFHPHHMTEAGYEEGPLHFLQHLYSMGYVHISHSGYVCDSRWSDLTRNWRLKGGLAMELGSYPNWCRLGADRFENLIHKISREFPETLLFSKGIEAASSRFEDEAVAAAAGGGKGSDM